MASERGVGVRFSRRANRKDATRLRQGQIVIVLESETDPSAFLARLKQMAGQTSVEPTGALAEEGYFLWADYEHDTAVRLRVSALSANGFHQGLLRIPDLLAIPKGELSSRVIPKFQAVVTSEGEALIADYPAFPIRGIVEGFYGKPWSHKDRLDILRFQGQHGMNTYIYAPKDDPYHRKLWREPYPAHEMKRLRELAATARENFVHFTFAVSPGLSMIYSSEAEFQALTRKIESVRALGVTDFALLLDDVPQDLVHPEDRSRFHSLAEAHIYLINRLYGHLKSLSPEYHLSVCPTTYTQEWGNREYIREIGAGVNPAIPLDWTGSEVIPPAITAAEAHEWARYLQRKPLVWDNFPVNDNHPWRLILEPMRGRDAGLATEIQGLFSNPMYQAHASMIPLETVADYLWNPPAYNAEPSFQHALVTQYGAEGPPLLAPILEAYQNLGERPAFAPLFDESNSPIDVPAIESRLKLLTKGIRALRTKAQFKTLLAELEPVPTIIRSRLDLVLASPNFTHLPNGRLEQDRQRRLLSAFHVSTPPALDGDFSKWKSGTVYVLDQRSQLDAGEELWRGADQFSARVAFAWDAANLYIGVDVVDSQFYQPFQGRRITEGDALRLIVDTGQTENSGRPVDVYDLYLSPGNFAEVHPDVYCDEDFFPPRRRPHNYSSEIRTTWQKTERGFSGDIVIPVSFLDRGKLEERFEIPLSFGALKTLQPANTESGDLNQIVFTSKEDNLFPVEAQNPATLQHLILIGSISD